MIGQPSIFSMSSFLYKEMCLNNVFTDYMLPGPWNYSAKNAIVQMLKVIMSLIFM